ncbi:MAG: CorA family divalent cation transporter [Patescibacteria group bacterium]
MISTCKYNHLTWVDLECPTSEEIKSVMTKFLIHPFVAEELLKPTFRPRVDAYKDTLYLILHFPIYNNVNREYRSCEIDFILGKNFLITTHYTTITPLYEIAKIFEAKGMIREKNISKNSGILFFYIIRQLYDFSETQLNLIESKIDFIGERMFEKKSTLYDLVRKISHIKKEILDFKRIIHFHKEIFYSLEAVAPKFFGEDFIYYLNNINGEYQKLWNVMENHIETIIALQNTLDSLLMHRSNDVMKILTMMALFTFPLTVIIGLFGIDTKILPLVIIIMVVVATGMLSYFKYKKWI